MNLLTAPQKPAEYAEDALISAILDGTYPPGTPLPAERELASQLGVTRPTVREVLQRLSRDGWLMIRQGKSTQVNDFWRDGGLNVLSVLVRHQSQLPADFIPNLLAVRLDLAPSYARAAVRHSPAAVAGYLAGWTALPDTAEAFAAFDWGLHRALTIAASNPIYTLILNGFAGFYEQMARQYFESAAARAASRQFYAALHAAAQANAADAAEAITRQVIEASIEFWRHVKSEPSRS
ncbi:MAG: fatty acid metabolism transcriptional regulator FadR [Herpetosiphonaceae bacterium]|nr:fatty acid metabolism transcriptional regulator FadR [Herpetosiphonaceae bacterium]